jgi:carbamoylphosphate synthase large subunit
MINILIVSGGSFQGSTLVKCLCASNSIVVNLADCFNENINKYEADKFHVVPPINDKNHFIDELINIVIKEDIKIIFPSTDYELPVLSENRHIFKKQGAMVAVSELHLIHILRNKLTTHSLLFSNGFNVLNQIDFRSENIELPIIGKPAIGFGSKGIIEIHTQEDYKSLGPKNIKNYIWQPLIIEFTEFSVDFAICFDGNISPLIIRKRLKTAGGFAVITQSECEKKISSEMYRFAQLLSDKGGCGIFNVQILKTLEGDCFFSDVNPRVGTSSVFSLGLSINLPLFMC